MAPWSNDLGTATRLVPRTALFLRSLKLYLLRFITYATERVQSQTPGLATCPSKVRCSVAAWDGARQVRCGEYLRNGQFTVSSLRRAQRAPIATVAVILLYVSQ